MAQILGALLDAAEALAHPSVPEILDVRAVDVVSLACQGADEAYTPVVSSEQRHDVGTFIAKKLFLSEMTANSVLRTYISMDAVLRSVLEQRSAVEAELLDLCQVHNYLVFHLWLYDAQKHRKVTDGHTAKTLEG
ncbi:hypothetical protein BBAD15_g12199 [Beauveria bassiana D1-5]|uniref:Uncharacterized protein n=1 Tax=Beauveria bassiana D1-5 TaxID=1245745 RepID=A0A0A2V536_BEABA|nr:hypothetical protein BBAD15_g12199 [Beauveria bassiana D1-5]